MWWCVERRAAEGKNRFSRKNVIFTVQTNNAIFNRETPSPPKALSQAQLTHIQHHRVHSTCLAHTHAEMAAEMP